MIQNRVMSYLEKFLLPHPAFYINEAEGPTGIQSSVVGARQLSYASAQDN
jgi:hypothetical protein